MDPDGLDNTPTNLSKPATAATLTIRVVKSFTYRTERSLVLHDLNLETVTCGELKELVRGVIRTQPAWKPYRNVELDTLKLYTKAHGAKSVNLIINLDNDDWVLADDNATLRDVGLENEGEVSFYNQKLFEEFKADPETKW